MAARKNISKRVRFEVFKRDSFTCQYCGISAPDVVLHVDHINPVAGGGDNGIMNLVTSCQDCNLGKGAKKLSDKSAIEKQKKQLDDLNERRLQLEMMLKWREEALNVQELQVDHIEKIIFKDLPSQLSEHGKNIVEKLIKKHGFDEVVTCADISRTQYAEFENGVFVPSSIEKIINYVGKIASSRQRTKENPDLSKLYYIRGIVRNRMYCNDWECLAILKEGLDFGLSIEEMADIAKTSRNWTQWRNNMYEVM